MADTLTQTPDLATLITSRICHDLIGPVGAIGNGLELIEAIGGAPTEEDMNLIGQSASLARARIGLFRLVFGRGAAEAATGEGFAALMTAALSRPRVTVEIAPPDTLGPEGARRAALALLCADKALPRGGTLAARWEGGVARISATGPRMTLHDHARALLSDPSIPPSEPAELEFHLLAQERPRLTSEGESLMITLG
ncbi:MAG: histidine phosphotransferase family protein [Rubricella sp.]